MSGGSGITKIGTGTETFAGPATAIGAMPGSTYTGTTTINGGTLALDFTNVAGATDLLASTSNLTVGGGTLSVIGATSTTFQRFNSLTVAAGGSSALNINQSAGGATTVALNGITRNTAGGAVAFSSTGTFTTTTTNTATTILGGWATIGGGANWAVTSATTNPLGGLNIISLATYTPDAWAAATPGNDTTVTSFSNSNPIAPDSFANSLQFNDSTTADTVTLSDTGVLFNTITSGGILVTSTVGPHANVITGGNLSSGNGKDLIVNQFNTNAAGSLTISSAIVNNGATSIGVTLTGGGTLVLSGANTYTGATSVDSGTLRAGALNTIPSASAVTVASGATLVLGGFNQSVASLNGAGSVTNNSNANATLTFGGGTFSGVISNTTGANTGTLGLAITGVTTLSGTNTYSGGTSIANTLSVSSDANLGATTGGVVINGGTLAATSSFTLSSSRGVALGSSGGAGTGTITVAATKTLTFAGAIVDNPSGTGDALVVGSSGNTGILQLNGASSYSGTTTVSAGTLALGLGASLGNTAITVNNGATFAPLPGSGSNSAGSSAAGSAGATLNLAASSKFSMVDGSIGTFNLQQQASFGAGSTALTLGGTTLSFEMGTSGSDRIAVGVGAASVSGTNSINLTAVSSSLTLGGAYPLITASGGLSSGGTFQLGSGSALPYYVAAGSKGYRISLVATPTAETAYVVASTNLIYNDTFAGTTGTSINGLQPNAVNLPAGAYTVFGSSGTGGATYFGSGLVQIGSRCRARPCR